MSCSWKSGSPENGRLWRNGVDSSYCCLARWARARFLWLDFLAMFGVADTVRTPLLDVTVANRCRLAACVRNSPLASFVVFRVFCPSFASFVRRSCLSCVFRRLLGVIKWTAYAWGALAPHSPPLSLRHCRVNSDCSFCSFQNWCNNRIW